jgi:hypothetical protein
MSTPAEARRPCAIVSTSDGTQFATAASVNQVLMAIGPAHERTEGENASNPILTAKDQPMISLPLARGQGRVWINANQIVTVRKPQPE